MCPYPSDEELQDSVPKSELRALANAAMQQWKHPVKRLPTMRELRCICGHRARVAVHPDRKEPRFRCSKCGTRS